MHKLSFPNTTPFKDLPFEMLNKARYAIYVIDRNWNYLFVNNFVAENLGIRGSKLEGKNMWATFPELKEDESFRNLKIQAEKGKEFNVITISPLTSQKIHITGKPLQDCYLFTSSILPKKEEVIDDLRSVMGMAKKY